MMIKKILSVLLSAAVCVTAVLSAYTENPSDGIDAEGYETDFTLPVDEHFSEYNMTYEEFVEKEYGLQPDEYALSADDNTLYEDYTQVLSAIRTALVNGRSYVTFSPVSRDVIYKVGHLMYLCFRSNLGMLMKTSSSGNVSRLDIQYNGITTDQLKAFYDELDNMLMYVEPGMTDLEAALTVNDYITLNYSYDVANYNAGTIPEVSYSAYGVMVNRTGVCMGYAGAFQLAMRTLGIPCEYITSDPMNHAWNQIYIDGEWYNVDTTWNDPVSDMTGRAYHIYFLFSDNGAAERDHYGWESAVECTSDKYDDYFWRTINSRILCLDGNMIYVSDFNNDNAIFVRAVGDDTGETLRKINGINTYIGTYGLEYFNSKLYFRTFRNSAEGWRISSYDLRDNTFTENVLGLNQITEGFYLSGKDIIYAARGDSSLYSVHLADTIEVRSIALAYPAEINVDATSGLTAYVLPIYADNTNVEWSSSDTSVLKVGRGGRITAIKEGIAGITVSATDGSGISITADITVTQPDTVPVVTVQSDTPDGMIDKGTAVTLSTDTVGAQIYYTTDGTDPSKDSELYTEPITIDKTTVIKAIAYKSPRPASEISEFKYNVAVSGSMSASLSDYALRVWNSGAKELDALKFTVMNTEDTQNVNAILTIFNSANAPSIVKSQPLTAENGENEITFSDLSLYADDIGEGSARLFIFGSELDMFPFGTQNSFNLGTLLR